MSCASAGKGHVNIFTRLLCAPWKLFFEVHKDEWIDNSVTSIISVPASVELFSNILQTLFSHTQVLNSSNHLKVPMIGNGPSMED